MRRNLSAKVIALTDAATIVVGDPADGVVLSVTIAGARTIANPTATPKDGAQFILRIKSDATARALTWGTMYLASGSVALPATTAVSKTHHVGFMYDATAAKLICMAADAIGY